MPLAILLNHFPNINLESEGGTVGMKEHAQTLVGNIL